jgi:hypothetical protein
MSGSLHDAGNGAGEALPFAGFAREALAAFSSETVELGAAIVLGEAPLGVDDAVQLESMKGWIERPFFDAQDFVGNLLDPLRDAPTVHRSAGEGFQDQHVQSALNEGAFGSISSHRCLIGVCGGVSGLSSGLRRLALKFSRWSADK